MKKLMAIALVAVFALSAVATITVSKVQATEDRCRAYCDFSTCYYWVCCPYTKSPNSSKVFWECEWGYPCCDPEG